MKIPTELDGAKVILCTDNNEMNDFGYVQYEDHHEAITAFAITEYDYDECYYLFSCDLEWNVIGDTLHSTIEEAKSYVENSINSKDFF